MTDWQEKGAIAFTRGTRVQFTPEEQAARAREHNRRKRAYEREAYHARKRATLSLQEREAKGPPPIATLKRGRSA